MLIELPLILLLCYLCLKMRSKPTRKIPPGPRGLPIVGYLPFLATSPTEKLTEISKTYGNLFTLKLGDELVLFINDLATMKEMGKMDVFQGRNQLEIIRPLRENRGLIFLEGQGWNEWRRFTLHTLKGMGFGGRTMETLIQDELRDLVLYLQKKANQPLYTKDFTDIIAVNGLWEILAGEKFDLEDEEKHRVLKIIEEGVADQSMMGLVTFLPKIAKLFPSLSGWNKAVKCFGSPFKLIRHTLDKHIENYGQHGKEKDFIDFALTKIYSTTDPSSCFYKQQGIENLFYTILDLFVTGSDTVSSTISWAFLFVTIYPEVQRKIQKEIDETIGSQRLPSISDKRKMVYTEAVMMEVLRRSSIVQFGAMHKALEDVDSFHGYCIPKGTIILWNLRHVHHDPLHWDDPNSFKPERFINSDGSLRKDEHLIPFFTGKRSCPAESVALNEFFLFFTGVLQKFDTELVDKSARVDLGPKPGFCTSPPKHNIILRERSTLN